MKNTKKGFTLVELLVVIAIVAILATVAIIGYTSFTNKADESADIYAVKQMNTVLQANVEKPTTIIEVSALLKANGFNVEDGIVPLYEGRSFYWYRPTNQMVYVNEENGKFELVFPESVSGFPAAKNDDCQTMPTINPDVALTVPSVPADTVYNFAAGNITTLPAGVTVPENLATFEDTVDWVNTFNDSVTVADVWSTVNGASKPGVVINSDIKLTKDVVIDVMAAWDAQGHGSTLIFNIEGNVTIDLNGYSITQKAHNAQSVALFAVRPGATLNIIDSSAEQTGAIYASYGFQVDATGTLNLYSGNVCWTPEEYRNERDIDNVSLIYLNGGTFNMYGGKLDATVTEDRITLAILGGGNNSTTNLYAGIITGYVDTHPAYMPNFNNYGVTGATIYQ